MIARSNHRADRGTAAVELVLVAPLLVMMLLLVAGLGRMATARGLVEGAARDAARAASLERSLAAATSVGRAAAGDSLAGSGVQCAELAVNVDAADYRPGGQVTATVVCTVAMARFGLAGFPGARTFRATAVVPIERWRGR